MKFNLRKIKICLFSVSILILAGPLSTTSTTPAHAATTPGYITLLVGRGMYGKMTAGKRSGRPEVAADRAVGGRQRYYDPNGRDDPHGHRRQLVRLMGRLAWLAGTYGWHVTDAGTYSLGSDPATIRSQTCDTLGVFYDHGFTDAWGMYDYPSGQYNATAAPIINSCFAYARIYGSKLNTGPTIPAPYSIRAESLDGGNCNLAGQPCSTIFQAQLQ